MKTITIKDNQTQKELELQVYESTLGSGVIDISSLNKELGLFTYDNGFEMTAGCT